MYICVDLEGEREWVGTRIDLLKHVYTRFKMNHFGCKDSKCTIYGLNNFSEISSIVTVCLKATLGLSSGSVYTSS